MVTQGQLDYKLLQGVLKRDVDKVKEALSERANPNYITKNRGYPLLYFCLPNFYAECDMVPYYEAGDSLGWLIKGFRSGNTEIAKLLLDHGANVNAQTRNSFTILDLAVDLFEKVDEDLKELVAPFIKLLLLYKPDLSIKSDNNTCVGDRYTLDELWTEVDKYFINDFDADDREIILEEIW